MSRVVHRLTVLLAGGVLAALLAAPAHAASYAVVYSFGKDAGDGGWPAAGLINVGGMLYGTTLVGGSGGTVFSLTQAGVEKVLHTFRAGTDGIAPYAGLINVGGTLYGTTLYGGAYGRANSGLGFGTVFSVTRAGVEKVLHSFGSGSDGIGPSALINVGGTLYGTTAGGGVNQGGTVFSLTQAGVEKVLYAFGSASGGYGPAAGLSIVRGTFYDTTVYGGVDGEGTVFSLTPAGVEKELYSFRKGKSDGVWPVGTLLNVGGTLYGTTSNGGAYTNCSDGCGTVFSVTPAGVEKVLHSFGAWPGGYQPGASLIEVDGTFYGTTVQGGINGTHPAGTVFSMTRTGVVRVLHYFFLNGSEGANPDGPLVNVGGTLYGTTYYGGAHDLGTVFKVTP